MLETLWRGAAMGVGATICFDLWERALSVVPGQEHPDWAPVGRWFGHLLRDGRVLRPDFARVAPIRHELALGWMAHYAVGSVLGIVFAACVGHDWLAAPTFPLALAFGIANIAFAWFLLFPGMGLGWAAAKTPTPHRKRILGLVEHTFFAAGLYGTALVLSRVAG